MIYDNMSYFIITLNDSNKREDYNCYYMDLDSFITNILNREDSKVQELASVNTKLKGTRFYNEINSLVNIISKKKTIKIYSPCDLKNIFEDFINVNRDIIVESLELTRILTRESQSFLDNYISDTYLANNHLVSVVNVALTINYSKIMDSDEDIFDEIFNEVYEQLLNRDGFELALINHSQNHSFYGTVEIPIKEYLKDQLEKLEALKSPV